VDWEPRHIALDSYGLIAFPVTGAERDAIIQQWQQRFFPRVFRETGEWVHRGYHWHAYTYGFEVAVKGADALAAYTARAERKLLVYFEDDALFDAYGEPSPDFSPWGQDLYVFPHDLAWTMVFTHEQEIGLGPFFALPSAHGCG
jgi:hypothetical protein